MVWAHLADGQWLTAEASHTFGDGDHEMKAGQTKKELDIDAIGQDLKEIGVLWEEAFKAS